MAPRTTFCMACWATRRSTTEADGTTPSNLLSNGAVQVTDLRPDTPDGTDTDFNFSSFQFADGTYSVSDLLSDKEPLGRFVSQRTHDLRADHEDHHGKPEHHGGIGHNMSEFVHQLHDLLL